MKQVDAVLIGDMHLVLKEPLPKDTKDTDEILIMVRLTPSTPPEFRSTETVVDA